MRLQSEASGATLAAKWRHAFNPNCGREEGRGQERTRKDPAAPWACGCGRARNHQRLGVPGG